MRSCIQLPLLAHSFSASVPPQENSACTQQSPCGRLGHGTSQNRRVRSCLVRPINHEWAKEDEGRNIRMWHGVTTQPHPAVMQPVRHLPLGSQKRHAASLRQKSSRLWIAQLPAGIRMLRIRQWCGCNVGKGQEGPCAWRATPDRREGWADHRARAHQATVLTAQRHARVGRGADGKRVGVERRIAGCGEKAAAERELGSAVSVQVNVSCAAAWHNQAAAQPASGKTGINDRLLTQCVKFAKHQPHRDADQTNDAQSRRQVAPVPCLWTARGSGALASLRLIELRVHRVRPV